MLKTRKLTVFFTGGMVLFPSPGVALPCSSSGCWPPAAASGESPVVRDFPSLATCQRTIQITLVVCSCHLVVMYFYLLSPQMMELQR